MPFAHAFDSHQAIITQCEPGSDAGLFSKETRDMTKTIVEQLDRRYDWRAFLIGVWIGFALAVLLVVVLLETFF